MAGGGEDSFIVSLGLLLGFTALVALLLSYANQSTIIAFIAVGVAVSSAGVKVDTVTLGHISEVGILILLFMAGLEVELEAFIREWKTVTIVGVGQIVCSTGFFALSSIFVLPAIGAEVTPAAAVYFGLCMCFSSTILVLGYLKNSKSMGTVYGQLCLGTLVLQDAASVLGIAALDGLASEGRIAIDILVLFGKLIAACLICFLLERTVLHKLFEAFARSLELLYLGALGYATGLAAIAVMAGFSGEITAFLAGVSLAQLPYKMHIETKMEPIKALGVATFFISLGLKLPLDKTMLESLPVGFGLAIFTLFATLPLFMGLGFLAKLKAHNVFMMGILMNQISEFSLILCTLCVRAGVFEPFVLTVMTVAAVISIIFSSFGHNYIDLIYRKMQRWKCFFCIDASNRSGFSLKDDRVEDPGETETTGRITEESSSDEQPEIGQTSSFEDQLVYRSTKQLEIFIEVNKKELEDKRLAMAVTADEKRLHFEKTTKLLYGKAGAMTSLFLGYDVTAAGSKTTKGDSLGTIIETSHATDIMHGMIEGYVIIDHNMMFCTLRTGRMLFWNNQHDVGHAPPISVWDISLMSILKVETKATEAPAIKMKNIEESEDIEIGMNYMSDTESTSDSDEEANEWEWTIVLGHIHRDTGMYSIEDDTMKLAIHGLEGYSDHDVEDWQDALSVATARLNPVALRLAHIRKELHSRRNCSTVPRIGSLEDLKAAHNDRDKIICIGYNEMFPAVIALADTVRKEVMVVEYDPMKINTIKELYNQEKRRQDLGDKNKKSRSSKESLKDAQRAYTTDEIREFVDTEEDRSPRKSRSLRRTRSMPILCTDDMGRQAQKEFLEGNAESDKQDSSSNSEGDEVKGVTCQYADIHDPECWEELGMDKAFMLVCTMGAMHAEKALLKWLQKHNSDTIFVACTGNNVEAIELYKAGAHFVMQTDALAMRSTREIFMASVANVGDCSQLVAAGLAHKKRLIGLKNENNLKFLYETGEC